MKKLITIFLIFALIACSRVLATDRYVSPTGTNDAAGGYTNWAGAATNIQDVVAMAIANDTIWVTNGTYYIPRPQVLLVDGVISWQGIMITNAITLKSVNGAVNTIIDGNQGVSTGRCVYLTGGGVVDGFTLRNAWAFAAGYPTESLNGAGVCINGAGTVRNCIITGNRSYWSGGGVQIWVGGGLLDNCIVNCNTGGTDSGGISMSYGNGSIVRNCLITKNAANGPGGGIKILEGAIQNCTIVSNYAASGAGGGLYVQDSPSYPNGSLLNNIIYYNTSTNGVDNLWGTNALFANNCIPTVLITTNSRVGSANNITNEPSFRDLNNANYRLSENSPCINTGTNQSWMTNAVDLDGRQRIRYGFVDVGVYEYIRPAGTIFTVH